MFIKVLGKPSPQSLSFITNEHALKFINDLPESPKRKPTEGVVYSNPLALDLIDKCLEFNPQDRLTVEEALAHPYLKLLHDPNDEPKFEGNLNFDFENPNFKLNDLKKMIIQDINQVNKFNKEEVYDISKIAQLHNI